jgi:hypothetical protein
MTDITTLHRLDANALMSGVGSLDIHVTRHPTSIGHAQRGRVFEVGCAARHHPASP